MIRQGFVVVLFSLLPITIGCSGGVESATASSSLTGSTEISSNPSVSVLGAEMMPSPTTLSVLKEVDRAVTSEKTSDIRGSENSDLPLVIFDTDMGPDIDDALALAILHEYADRGKIELAAVTVSRSGSNGAKFSDVLNTYYQRPDIPIGSYKGSVNTNSDLYSSLADEYPHDLQVSLEGYMVQRQVLADAEAAGRTVIMIQVGFSGNISQLLDSQGDDISPKSGVGLVADNVSSLSIMAGHFGSGPEFNIHNDLPSAKNLFANWPVEMVVSDWNVGGYILYPHSAITKNLSSVANHPIKKAYECDCPFANWHEKSGSYYNMRSWDLTSVLEAVEPDANYFVRSEAGTVTLGGDGTSYFEEGSGNHYILSDSRNYSVEQRQKIIDRMIALID